MLQIINPSRTSKLQSTSNKNISLPFPERLFQAAGHCEPTAYSMRRFMGHITKPNKINTAQQVFNQNQQAMENAPRRLLPRSVTPQPPSPDPTATHPGQLPLRTTGTPHQGQHRQPPPLLLTGSRGFEQACSRQSQRASPASVSLDYQQVLQELKKSRADWESEHRVAARKTQNKAGPPGNQLQQLIKTLVYARNVYPVREQTRKTKRSSKSDSKKMYQSLNKQVIQKLAQIYRASPQRPSASPDRNCKLRRQHKSYSTRDSATTRNQYQAVKYNFNNAIQSLKSPGKHCQAHDGSEENFGEEIIKWGNRKYERMHRIKERNS